MLSNPTTGRRLTGRMMIVLAVAVALPLTATRAINYVDIPVPAIPAASETPVVPEAAPVPSPAPASGTADQPAKQLRVERDMNMIGGKSKQWNDLTTAEKAEVRRSIAEAREELGRTRIDREEIERDVREAMAEARIDQDDLRRELAEAQADIAKAMKELDAHAVEIRRSGQDPEQLKATIRASLKGLENLDIEAIKRDALSSLDPGRIQESLAVAEAGIRAAQEELDRQDALDRAD